MAYTPEEQARIDAVMKQFLDASKGYESTTTPPASTTTPASTPPSSVTTPTSPGPVDVQPGLDWQYKQETLAIQKYIADLQAKTSRDIAAINAASDRESRVATASLQAKLASGQIDAQKYMQAKELVQRESEFARDLALRTLISDRDNELNRAKLSLDKADQARQERLLQAQLASNPADTVLYEFYKRGLTGGVNNPMGTAANQAGPTGQELRTGNFAPVTAYDDKTMQTLASMVQGEGGQQPMYNPELKGTGAFGAQIGSPNELSRAEVANLDPTQMAVLSSFLKAGVQTRPGDDSSRVAINPEDYFKQVEDSWIPALNTNSMTRYI